jgi:Tfp pilus assembly protein PilF
MSKPPLISSDIQYREQLIDKYFRRQLSAQEQSDFVRFVKMDPSFRANLDEQKTFLRQIYEAVSPHRRSLWLQVTIQGLQIVDSQPLAKDQKK